LDPATQFLRPEVLKQVEEIGAADILVGIPSYHNVATVGGVVEAAAQGLSYYFSGLKAVLVNSDGTSDDGTREAVLNAPLPSGIEKIVTVYKGPPGKGSALKTIFEIANKLEAKMCLTLDADSRSITPHWIKALGDPIHTQSYGYVTPYYLRDKHDGTVTNFLVYPLIRALFGLKVRQPIGGDFGLTGGLVLALARQRVWGYETDVNRFGIDTWMTTTAINEGFRVCQAALGVKIHNPKHPGKDMRNMFKQVVGTLFGLMRKYEIKWKTVKETKTARIIGKFHFVELEELKVGFPELIKNFKKGALESKKLWVEILDPKNYSQVTALTGLKNTDFRFPVELWVRIVYDYAIAYNFAPFDKDDILESLLPLYFGRTAAFILETQTITDELADAVVEGIAGIFERLKPYLLKRWENAKQEYLGAPQKTRIRMEKKIFRL